MFYNLKELFSTVQDGLNTNNNLKKTLHEVQKVKYIFKEKQKPSVDSKVNYGAGAALLEKYQQNWAELHENSDKNAKAAEKVDNIILEVHEKSETRLLHSADFCQSLAQLPKLSASLDECINTLNSVKSLIFIVENELAELEDLVELNNMAKWKLDHHYHLSLYKEKKLAELEGIRGKLAHDNAEKSCERERRQLAELQARQDISGAAFHGEVACYLSTGALPPRTQPVPEVTLEQIQLDTNNDDLDKFLNSS